MTQTPSRDWQKDMRQTEIAKELREMAKIDTEELDTTIYWLQEARRYMEAWEDLREIVSTNATGGRGEDINDYDIMLNIMKSLYPDTPAPKEGTNE